MRLSGLGAAVGWYNIRWNSTLVDSCGVFLLGCSGSNTSSIPVRMFVWVGVFERVFLLKYLTNYRTGGICERL